MSNLSLSLCVLVLLLQVHWSMQRATMSQYTGINIGFSPTEEKYRLAHSLGIHWVRISTPEWAWGYPNMDYSQLDQAVAWGKKYGIKHLCVCLGTPSVYNGGHPYDSEGDKFPPESKYYSKWGTFCASFAHHGCDAIEVWNEPNNPGFWSSGIHANSASIFAHMQIAAYKAIKAVNHKITVISAGLSPSGDFLDPAQAHSVRYAGPVNYTRLLFKVPHFAESFDGFGIHPYCFGNGADPLTSSVGWNTFKQVPLIHQILTEHKVGNKPIWATEWGAPVLAKDHISVEGQKTLFEEYYKGFTQYYKSFPMGPNFVYMLADIDESDPSGLGTFGVYFNNMTAKPASTVIKRWAASTLVSSHHAHH